MTKVQEEKIKIEADQMPNFMYKQETPYDRNNFQRGFCWGFVLLRVSPACNLNLLLTRSLLGQPLNYLLKA